MTAGVAGSFPLPVRAAYSAAKAGLDDAAAAIRVLIDGPLTSPAARLVTPEEIAALVASPLGASINGATLRLDGGMVPTVT